MSSAVTGLSAVPVPVGRDRVSARRRPGARGLTTEADRPNGVESVPLWLGSPDRPLFAWLDLPDNGLVAGAAILCPTMGLESAYSARALRDLAHRLASSGLGRASGGLRGHGRLGRHMDRPRPGGGMAARRPRRHRLCQRPRGAAGGCDRAPARRHAGCRRACPRRWRGRPGAVGPVRHGQGVPPRTACPVGLRAGPDQRRRGPRREEADARGSFGRGRAGRGTRRRVLRNDRLGTRAARNRAERPEPCLPGARAGPRGKEARACCWRSVGPCPTSSSPRSAGRTISSRKSGHHAGADAGADRLLAHGIRRVRGHARRADTTDCGRAPDEGSARCARTTGPARAGTPLRDAQRTGGAGRAVGSDRRLPQRRTDRSSGPGDGSGWNWPGRGRRVALRCLRVDLSGLGDSPTRPGRTELVEFPADALEDLDDIRAAAAAQEGADLIFVGLCSGADHAIEAALARTDCVHLRGQSRAVLSCDGAEHRYRRFEPNLEGSSGSSDRQSWGSTRPWLTRAMARVGPVAERDAQDPQLWLVDCEPLVHDGKPGPDLGAPG